MARMIEAPELKIAEEVTVDPKHTALIIVDMQNDFVKPEGALFGEEGPKIIEPCRQLLEKAREHDMFVAFTQDTHYEGDPEWEIWGEHCRKGTWGWEIIPELKPLAHERVFEKVRYDGFYGTGLDHELRLRNIDTLIICGTVANICVHYTAASAGLRWYRIIHPVDAIAALSEFDRIAAFHQASWLFGAVLTKSTSIQVQAEQKEAV